MDSERAERRLAAIMFTDIVGYTALMAASEEKGLRAREHHRALIRPLVERYHGESIEARGDESLSVFPSALDAVNCALAIRDRVKSAADLKLHIGIHVGDILLQGGEVSGDGVNVASRICSLSEGGGLCVSGEVYQSVRNQPNIEATPLGAHELKNVGRPVAVFAVTGTANPPRASSAPRWRRDARTGRRAALIAGVLIIAAVGGWRLNRGVTDLALIRSIAVLPLENLSGDPDQDYFADGMTEALIGDLAKIGALRVISRTSAMRYRNSDKSLPEIARELGVEGIVEGTVMRAGDRVRITAQLIDARSDQHVWADRFDRDLRSVLALQSEIARSVAREIRVVLTPEEGRQLSHTEAVEPAAHEAYLRGRYFWNKRSGQGLRRAIGYFEAAIEEDPGYARAYAGLADSYALLPGYTAEPATEAMPRAEAAARTALAIDESLAEAHISLGFVRAFYHWDWSGAEQSFRRAIELDPRYAMAHSWYGILLRATGRAREALAEIERAHELDPLALVTNRNLGETYLVVGDRERAIEQLLHTLELDPDFPLTHRALADAYLQQGQEERALALAAQRLNDAEAAWIYARAGRREEALRRLAGSGQASERGHVYAWLRAMAYAALGDDERTFEWLERAYEVRELGLGLLLRTERAFVPLYADPRFQDLLRRMNFPEAAGGIGAAGGRD